MRKSILDSSPVYGKIKDYLLQGNYGIYCLEEEEDFEEKGIVLNNIKLDNLLYVYYLPSEKPIMNLADTTKEEKCFTNRRVLQIFFDLCGIDHPI